jgi:GNAT superfamily N-acetyltransferase
MSTAVTTVEIRPTRFRAPVAQQLIAAAQDELTQRYGSGDANPIESVQFDPPEGIFLVAWLDGNPVGCAGWRTYSHFRVNGELAEAGERGTEDVAEIKRMFVVPEARNAGVASALLAALENSAREAGMKRMILETGLAQPEAMALYEKLGYSRIPNYGYYRDSADCVSYGRDL